MNNGQDRRGLISGGVQRYLQHNLSRFARRACVVDENRAAEPGLREASCLVLRLDSQSAHSLQAEERYYWQYVNLLDYMVERKPVHVGCFENRHGYSFEANHHGSH
jgi:hypothetical protein